VTAAVVDLLLEALGGRPVWAEARAVHTRERVLVPAFPDPIVSDVWRSLREPGEMARITGVGVDRTFAWDARGGSGVKEGEHYRFGEDRMRDELAFWPVHLYTIYHRLAAGDDSLSVGAGENGSVVLEDTQTGVYLGGLRVSARGEPMWWNGRTAYNDETYVYGPLGDYGSLRMPRWGASTNGQWRYELLDFELDEKPLVIELP
jgi:hypothetical protein